MGHQRGALAFLALAVALPVASCNSAQPAKATPPRICKAPPATPGFPWFQEVTSDFGLASTPAIVVIAADFDGDGWSDLVTSGGSSARSTKPTHFLFLSRPNPLVPGARTFVDATQDSGLLATRDGQGGRGWGITNAGDLDGNGTVDLVLCPSDEITTSYAPQDPCDAFLNDGKGHFTLAPPSDLDTKPHWYPSASLLDYDQDGVLDFWPATVAHWPYNPTDPNDPPTLYRGNGDGTFTNVSAQVGLPTADGTAASGKQWRHVFGVVACDIDGDGDDDMIFADYGREENQVWRNDSGTFTNVAHDLGIDHDDRQSYQDDQSYRCFCEANPTSTACSPTPPAPIVDCCEFCKQNNYACPSVTCPPYFRNWYPGSGDQPYNLGGNYFSFACGDMNNDGLMDLMSATIQHGDVGSSEDPSELIMNPGGGGKFTRPGNTTNGLDRPEPPSRGLYWNHGDDNMVMVDVDLDGLKDVFSTTTGAYEISDTHHLWRQTSLGKFQDITYPVGLLANGDVPNLQGPAFVDVDGDGDLDIVAGQANGQAIHVYRNLVGQNQNLTRIRLVGAGPAAGGASPSAIGAVVKVTAGGQTQTQYVSGGYGHGNVQGDLVLTFGLGAACDIDTIEVHWPDASHSVSTYANVLANYAITLTQGVTEVAYAP